MGHALQPEVVADPARLIGMLTYVPFAQRLAPGLLFTHFNRGGGNLT